MGKLSLTKGILEYFIDLDRIAKKIDEIGDVDIDCVGLDLQFYFEERDIDTKKLLKEIDQNKNFSQYEEISTKSKIAEYFKWLVIDFKKLVEESESNCNEWQTQTKELERKRIQIDQLLSKKEEILT